jgi:Asp-tRNA(Asn)/Glu-tRNA(Gln) amidotransferase A subunit family amidase
MKSLSTNRLTPLSAAARGIAERRFTSEGLVRASIERAVDREPELQAWACLDAEHALREARQRDRQASQGPLHGIPVAIKDLSDTRTHPTAYGSPVYADHRPATDAACVALARAAGAVVMGKTATVEFGASKPCATTNPRNKLHTPGGSSAGSAAVVADRQILLATGTQTGGSIIRPAAFCGAVGFKPTFGAISPVGTKGYSWSLDTVGAFASCVDDVAVFFDVLRGVRHGRAPDRRDHAPRIGVFLGPFIDTATQPAIDVLEAVASLCSESGAAVSRVVWPAGFDRSISWQRTISRYEMGRSLLPEQHSTRSTALGEVLLREIAEGQRVGEADYVDAKERTAHLARDVDDLFARFDVLLTLATPGEAPHGLGSTGDATFCLSWSLLGLPCLALPVAVGPQGLPLSIQLVGARYCDHTLLQIGGWIEELTPTPYLQEPR